ncbi:MAG: DNA photolyase [bacterium]
MPYKKIYINKKIKNKSVSKIVINNLPKGELVYLNEQAVKNILNTPKEKNLKDFSNSLFITENKGRFIKSCPGTTEYICCLYHILTLGFNCSLGCSYCILQAYFKNPQLTIFANLDDMFQELDIFFCKNPQKFLRIGTGEFTDSLLLDRITNFSAQLIPFFAKQNKAILELKTKTTLIENLLDLNHKQKTFISWSLNSPVIIKNEELFTSSLYNRLQAAKRCQDKGYPLGFHFDPIFYYPNWEKDYSETINRLFDYINPKGVVWISMGCFRYMPELKQVISTNYPNSKIIYQEFIDGMDKKKRYLKTVRIEIYKRIASWIRSIDKDILLYLCMESQEVWEKALGIDLKSSEVLGKMLDLRAIQFSSLTRKGFADTI